MNHNSPSVLARACILLWAGILSTLSTAAAERVVAYAVPAGTAGTQAFDGVIGMDFDVVNPVIVTRLGVFDDNSDGLKRTITARIYDRGNPDAPQLVATLEFTPEEPGTLEGGSRFKALATTIRLEVGFKGTITAENYGAEERLRNSGGTLANRTWTLNDGNGSLQFVGASRYGVTQGEYPGVADGGPADRYGAGTFEFETTPPLKPGIPASVTIQPQDQKIVLAWQAVTNPLPATKYEIQRGASRQGPFTKIAESTTPAYTDTNLVNGQLYAYQVRGLSANGQQGDFSAAISAAPYVLPAGQKVAYLVNAGQAGTQNFGGVLGMDFEVANPVIITHLGVFDDGSDGLALAITARLWDASVPDAPVELASLEFTPDVPGDLIQGSRFKKLATPVRLEAGVKAVISAEGYGAEERDLNPGGGLTATRPWTLDTGSSSLRFTGVGRYAVTPGEFPATPDGGVPDRYGAGTFQFQTTELVSPSVPVVTSKPGDLSVTLSWPAVTAPAPATNYIIMRSVDGAEPTVRAQSATPGYVDSGLTKGASYCYSVISVAATGKQSAASSSVCLTAEAREAGIAYIVAAGTVGSQAFGGGLGMDFDVNQPIRITRLGVFDDSSDGLFLAINARLYNRATRELLATLNFTPEDAGELIDSSRFKTLATPIILPAGFQGTIAASGYGGDERNGNGVAGRSVFGAGGSITFVGTGRYGVTPDAFPDVPDGGPYNRYAAGTFYFEPATITQGPTLAITRAGAKVTISWTGGGTLETASTVAGPWTTVTGGGPGIPLDANASAAFYRVKQ